MKNEHIYGINWEELTDKLQTSYSEMMEMPENERRAFIAENDIYFEPYTTEAWFAYLNDNKIDTENMYWFIF